MSMLQELWQGSGVAQIGIGQIVMILVCLGLLYLAIVKKFEPLLLVTIGFGGLLSNIPGVEIATGDGLLHLIYVLGLETGAFPLIIFMGVGALTDFGPLLANPKTLLLGAAAQFGIFATLLGAVGLSQLGVFDLRFGKPPQLVLLVVQTAPQQFMFQAFSRLNSLVPLRWQLILTWR